MSQSPQAPDTNRGLVDEEIARRLAAEHHLPPIEVDAALYGESVETAESVLRWVDEEEFRLTNEHGLLEGRRLYRPVRMLRSWARKNGAGRDRGKGSPRQTGPRQTRQTQEE